MKDVVQAHNVGMTQFFQEGNFADCSARNAFVFVVQADSLQGHNVACGAVLGFVNDAVSAFSKLFDLLVFFHGMCKRRIALVHEMLLNGMNLSFEVESSLTRLYLEVARTESILSQTWNLLHVTHTASSCSSPSLGFGGPIVASDLGCWVAA